MTLGPVTYSTGLIYLWFVLFPLQRLSYTFQGLMGPVTSHSFALLMFSNSSCMLIFCVIFPINMSGLVKAFQSWAW